MASFLPSSQSTVKVYIISPNRVLGVPPSAFLTPDISGTTYSDTPCLCFLIEHTGVGGRTSRVLFDLGIRKDWENSPPSVAEAVRSMNIKIDTPHDVADLLIANCWDLESIDHIILSHWHFDHVGDPKRFRKTTSVVVGPGVKKHCLPGYPTTPDSMLDDEAFQGRKVEEADFSSSSLRIADLEAIDWFGDGSFYLLNTPGHAVGHLSALARTTAIRDGADSSFILLAGDVCHHAGELRPSHLQPLPHNIPADAASVHPSRLDFCKLHPHHDLKQPFYCPSSGGFNLDAELMAKTRDKIAVLDSDPNVFVVLAHDHWLLDVIDLFPSAANEWRAKSWDEKARWTFLRDFA